MLSGPPSNVFFFFFSFLDRLIDKQDKIRGSLQDSFEWRSHLRYIWSETSIGLSVKVGV